jgi:hypothetical protein
MLHWQLHVFKIKVITVVFQTIFNLEMLQNNIFFILKKLLFTLAYQNDLKTQKKKIKVKTNSIFIKNTFKIQKQTGSKYICSIKEIEAENDHENQCGYGYKA